MTTGIQETFDDVRRGNASGIVDTITRNPVPAAMVAVGLGLLFMNRGAQSSHNGNGWSKGYGTGYGRGYGRAGGGDWQRWPDQGSPMDRVSSRMSSMTEDAGETVQGFTDEASRRVQDMGEQVGQTASQVQDQAGMAVQRGASEARRMFDENPIVFGAVAVAAGAAIGMLAPSTEAERRTLGPARDRFVEQAEQQVNQAIDSMDQGGARPSSATTGSSGSSRSAGSTATASTGSGSTSTRATGTGSRSSTVGSGGTSTSRGSKSSSGSTSARSGGSAATNQSGAPD